MNSPLIGITTSHIKLSSPVPSAGVSETYIQSVRRAGATPVLIPPGLKGAELETLRTRLDGVLFTGGGDIDPQLFAGRPHARVYDIDPERDSLEIDLVRMAAQSDWPFMGICRGIQVINVALGGTLYTHIADQLPGALKRTDRVKRIPGMVSHAHCCGLAIRDQLGLNYRSNCLGQGWRANATVGRAVRELQRKRLVGTPRGLASAVIEIRKWVYCPGFKY